VLVEDGQGFQLFEAIEQAKRTLSSANEAEVRFEYPGIDVREPVTRAAFEEASARVVREIVECMDETVRRAGVTPEEITVVCATGGTAKVPRLAAELAARLPAARMELFKSFHSVVQGLAEEARAREVA
jgi:hypothetical chaperone protein